ncbi:hypothetical protein IWW50_003067, partial [Coemansia erecta]
ISVQNLSMKYRTDLDYVLNDLSFDVKACEKVGVVGRTGAGKSTLIHALLRLIEAETGAVLIDGIDISTIGLHDLRSRISIVPQDPVLFEGTIRENLDPENKYTDDTLWAAIQTAQIGDLLDVPTGKYTPDSQNISGANSSDQPGAWVAGTGLEKWVEADGRNFSVGQRQLVCLCRALLWQRKILILDEATANVDSKTDALMQEIISKEFKDCTILTIAHRINTIMDCDRVLVMDHGRVTEFDTPNKLLATKGSRFAQLVQNTEFNDE